MKQDGFTFKPRPDFTFSEAEVGGVFLLDHDLTPMLPITNRKARWLLENKKAAVYRHYPFTVVLKDLYVGQKLNYPIEFKADPGSKATGLVLVVNIKGERTVVWAANLTHRGWQVHKSLESRAAVRRSRRQRKTRYRPPRFNNRVRTKKEGWLAPSLMSRVNNVANWLKKLRKLAPITEVAIESVRFDMQKMRNPEIEGVEYQQGTLEGYEMREYLLEKFERKCVYCTPKASKTEGQPEVDKPLKRVKLQIEHVIPKARGGTNAVTNLVLACQKCNQKKGTKTIDEFLANKPELLKRIKSKLKAPLKDAAAVNATRYKILEVLNESGLPVTSWTGGRTKMNRVKQKYPKDHWIDAACVGETGECVRIPTDLKPLEVKAMGRGNRRMLIRCTKEGFPLKDPKDPNNRQFGIKARNKTVGGFQTGDFIKMSHGDSVFTARIYGLSLKEKRVVIIHPVTKKTISTKPNKCQLIQKTDGYQYAHGKSLQEVVEAETV
jgi:5-methylcytosine-specific restriction endonuclease McrA